MTKQTVGERTAELERKRLRRADGSAPGEPISITSSPSVRKRAQALTSRLCLTGCSLAALLCLASAASESITESVQLAAVSGEEERQGRQVAPSESKAFPVPDLLLMARLFNPDAQSAQPIEPPEPEPAPERTVAPPTQTTGHSDAPTAANSGSHLLLLLFVLLALINLIVILGNILVIVAFYATAKLRNVTNIFIVSLATADLLLGLLVLPYALMFEVSYWELLLLLLLLLRQQLRISRRVDDCLYASAGELEVEVRVWIRMQIQMRMQIWIRPQTQIRIRIRI